MCTVTFKSALKFSAVPVIVRLLSFLKLFLVNWKNCIFVKKYYSGLLRRVSRFFYFVMLSVVMLYDVMLSVNALKLMGLSSLLIASDPLEPTGPTVLLMSGTHCQPGPYNGSSILRSLMPRPYLRTLD